MAPPSRLAGPRRRTTRSSSSSPTSWLRSWPSVYAANRLSRRDPLPLPRFCFLLVLLACAGGAPLPARAGAGSGEPAATRPDASVASGECFTHPDFASCATHCSSGSAPVIGTQLRALQPCTRACACGFGAMDLTGGCTADSDCRVVRADCCGCEKGGVSTAILEEHLGTWEGAMKARCPPLVPALEGCTPVILCEGTEAVCEQGRCVARARDESGSLPPPSPGKSDSDEGWCATRNGTLDQIYFCLTSIFIEGGDKPHPRRLVGMLGLDRRVGPDANRRLLVGAIMGDARQVASALARGARVDGPLWRLDLPPTDWTSPARLR